jgi:hypothetical protein
MTDTTTEQQTDPFILAARANCAKDCPGPTAHELAGFGPPHRCASTRPAAELVVEDVLASGRALSDQMERARATAVFLEQWTAELTRLTLELVGPECAEHPGDPLADPECNHCLLIAFMSGEAEERDAALAALQAVE